MQKISYSGLIEHLNKGKGFDGAATFLSKIWCLCSNVCSALIEHLKKGMGFHGAATFLGKIWCLCSNEELCTPWSICALSLPNAAVGLFSSCEFNAWNFYSPKKTRGSAVLHFPEVKLINPSNTCWLAHERGEEKLCCNCDCS